MSDQAQSFDIAVVGTGPAGLAAALALAELGLKIALVGPDQASDGRHEDRRTAALFDGSIEFLRNLKIWDDCADTSAPLCGIRMIDARKTLLRAPEVVFHATDAGRAIFGYNVPNHTLTQALWRRVRTTQEVITLVATRSVESIDVNQTPSALRLADGSQIAATLIVGADGRNSISRAAAGITTQSWTYPQTAIACSFEHDRSHDNISTEFHDTDGPMTTVPLPGRRSSLVWVMSPQAADHVQSLDDAGFAATLETQLQGLLGTISAPTPRAAFPLSAMVADAFGANGVALIGEAAHVIPPIGAQGLNLGLRDCAELTDCILTSLQTGTALDSAETLSRFNTKRDFDIRSRTRAVDMFNRSLLTSFVPAHLARGAALHMLKTITPLRRRVIEEGLTPTGVTPTLLAPDGLAQLRDHLASPT